jgi:hypothetical protein
MSIIIENQHYAHAKNAVETEKKARLLREAVVALLNHRSIPQVWAVAIFGSSSPYKLIFPNVLYVSTV